MSETLLNSIGVRGNRSFYMTPVSAVPQNNTKPQIEKKEENNPQKSSKMLTLGLAGLAVIGGGVVVAKSLQIYKDKKLTREIAELKGQLKKQYLYQRDVAINELIEEGLPKSFLYDEIGVTKVKSSKDIRKVKNYYQDWSNKFHEAQERCVKTVRKSVAKLENDQEWKELRKYRKELMKDFDSNDLGRHDVAVKKFPLINDLLTIKLFPEKEEVFHARNLVSLDNARMLVKKNFANAKEFNEEFEKCREFSFDYLPMERFFVNKDELSLMDFFKEEVITYRKCEQKLVQLIPIFRDDIPQVEKRLHKKLTRLALDFRKSEQAQKLRELVKQKYSK